MQSTQLLGFSTKYIEKMFCIISDPSEVMRLNHWTGSIQLRRSHVYFTFTTASSAPHHVIQHLLLDGNHGC